MCRIDANFDSVNRKRILLCRILEHRATVTLPEIVTLFSSISQDQCQSSDLTLSIGVTSLTERVRQLTEDGKPQTIKVFLTAWPKCVW